HHSAEEVEAEVGLGNVHGQYLVAARGPFGVGLLFRIDVFGVYSGYVFAGDDESCKKQDYEEGSSHRADYNISRYNSSIYDKYIKVNIKFWARPRLGAPGDIRAGRNHARALRRIRRAGRFWL